MAIISLADLLGDAVSAKSRISEAEVNEAKQVGEVSSAEDDMQDENTVHITLMRLNLKN